MTGLSGQDVKQLLRLNQLTHEVEKVDELRREVLREMETIFHASAGVFLLGPSSSWVSCFDRFVGRGLSDDFPMLYCSRFYASDPFAHYLRSRPGYELEHEVLIGEEFVSYGELSDTYFYRKYMRPNNICHMLRLELVINRRSVGSLGLFRPEGEANFTELDATKALMSSGAIANALARELQKEEAEDNLSLLADCTSTLSTVGILILDENLTTIYCDKNARESFCYLEQNFEGSYDPFLLPECLRKPITGFCQNLQKRQGANNKEISFSIPGGRPGETLDVRLKLQQGKNGRSRILVFLAEKQPQLRWARRLVNFGLTRREVEIVPLVVTGFRNAEIAGKLCISINTVQTHLSSIFDKLGVRNRAGLIARATASIENG